jgi:DNA primase
MLWLLRASIGYDLARVYGIGYSPKSNRVILPVHELDGELVAFIARATDNQQPKYIAKYKQGNIDAVFTSLHKEGSPFDLVVTEDCLSAIRVGRFNTARSLLGTSADAGKIMSLLAGLPRLPRIAVWLDGDKAGKNGRNKLVRQLVLQGAEVKRINTPKDPKMYTNAEIERIIHGARYGAVEVDA